jgi:hypothetical protein
MVGRGRHGITNGNFGSDRRYYWTLSRRRRFYSHAKPISVWNRVVEFLKPMTRPAASFMSTTSSPVSSQTCSWWRSLNHAVGSVPLGRRAHQLGHTGS